MLRCLGEFWELAADMRMARDPEGLPIPLGETLGKGLAPALAPTAYSLPLLGAGGSILSILSLQLCLELHCACLQNLVIVPVSFLFTLTNKSPESMAAKWK